MNVAKEIKSDDFSIVIASVPHRENCICEIYYDGNQWVEIYKEGETAMIEFHSHSDLKFWDLPLDLALDVLNQAKELYLYGKYES